MKTPQEWSAHWNQLKLNATPNGLNRFIEDIQRDALASPDCGDAAALQSVQVLLDVANASAMEYRRKWLEARKHLRAANKGAERNAIAMQLAVKRGLDMAQINRELQIKLSMETVNRTVAAACFHYEANKNEYLKLAHEKSIQENSQESH